MKKVALSGSIGMGKSTVAQMFRDLGVKVWCADDAVHLLYRNGGAANEILAREFGAIKDENGDIDRKRLSAIIVKSSEKLRIVEKIVHPLVQRDRDDFSHKNQNQDYVIFDIPLLFETNAQNNFDKIIIVNAPPEVQKARVLARPDMNEEKFATIMAKQIANEIKCAAADYIINTGTDLESTRREVLNVHKEISNFARIGKN